MKINEITKKTNLTEGRVDIDVLFKRMFKVSKDAGSMRKKGVLLETIDDALTSQYNLKHVTSKFEDGIIPTNTVIYANKDKSVGLYYSYATMGIPTLLIGTNSMEKYREIYLFLKGKSLVR